MAVKVTPEVAAFTKSINWGPKLTNKNNAKPIKNIGKNSFRLFSFLIFSMLILNFPRFIFTVLFFILIFLNLIVNNFFKN